MPLSEATKQEKKALRAALKEEGITILNIEEVSGDYLREKITASFLRLQAGNVPIPAGLYPLREKSSRAIVAPKKEKEEIFEELRGICKKLFLEPVETWD